MNNKILKDAIEFYTNEINDFYMYQELAKIEKNSELKNELIRI